MNLPPLALGLLILIPLATSTGPVPVHHSGLAEINGFTFYKPYCAHGCFRYFSSFSLPCSSVISPGGHTTANEAAHNLAICRASNWPYLSSIAWCIHEFCPEDVGASTIEEFRETEITGDVNVLSESSYGEVLANTTTTPAKVANESNVNAVLNTTVVTTHEYWQATWVTLAYFFRETALESYFGYVGHSP
jgi:hypothetical protein